MKINILPRDLAMLRRKIDRVDFSHIDRDLLLMFSYQVILEKKITGATKGRHSFVVVVNATGDIVGASRWNMRLWTPKLLNCSTIYMLSTAMDTHEDYRSNARFTMWNSATNRLVRVPIHGATHDLHYDPPSQTLFWLKNLMLDNPCRFRNSVCTSKKFTAANFKSDDIIRCKMTGQSIWRWSAVERLLETKVPFSVPFSFGDRCDVDFAHMNTVLFSAEQNAVYWNSRTLHSFFKLDATTGRILWSVGRFSTVTMYDEAGAVVPELFHHAHGLHPIANASFLLFDNLQNANCGIRSRLLQIDVDEAKLTARIVWKWAPESPEDCRRLYRNYGGGVHRAPSGLTIGAFGDRPQHSIVGVSLDGKPVFSMGVRQAFVYHAILFRRHALIQDVQLQSHTVSFAVYDALYSVAPVGAAVWVEDHCGGRPPARTPITLLPFWQPTTVTLPRPPRGGFTVRVTTGTGAEARHRVDLPCG
eukprot:EG_transcript_9404